MNDEEMKEAMFLLGELNLVELYGLIFGLLEANVPSDFELVALKHLVSVVKSERL